MDSHNHAEFTSLITHQLREPLTQIKWAISLLVNGEAGELNPEQKDFLDKALKSGEHALSLIDDMLKADKIESGITDLFFVEADIVEILQGIVSELKPRAENKKIDLSFDGSHKNIPPISIDADHIKEALLNVVENAINYSLPNGSVHVSALQKGGVVEIIIKDIGIGIPDEDALKIFSKFFRARNAKEAHIQGSGLGLYIVKAIIEKHNGKIHFEKNETGGTTFFIDLPLNN